METEGCASCWRHLTRGGKSSIRGLLLLRLLLRRLVGGVIWLWGELAIWVLLHSICALLLAIWLWVRLAILVIHWLGRLLEGLLGNRVAPLVPRDDRIPILVILWVGLWRAINGRPRPCHGAAPAHSWSTKVDWLWLAPGSPLGRRLHLQRLLLLLLLHACNVKGLRVHWVVRGRRLWALHHLLNLRLLSGELLYICLHFMQGFIHMLGRRVLVGWPLVSCRRVVGGRTGRRLGSLGQPVVADR